MLKNINTMNFYSFVLMLLIVVIIIIKQKHMTKFSDIFKQVDEQWIAEHPELMMETFRLLCAELDRRSEVIEILREKEMILTAIIESNKE